MPVSPIKHETPRRSCLLPPPLLFATAWKETRWLVNG
ncbi:hypothetical protein Vi05172_g899 [Venturia inaequalis]|nr:hypothetical protein Vi05172_g899 [Venturia inaequalis]